GRVEEGLLHLGPQLQHGELLRGAGGGGGRGGRERGVAGEVADPAAGVLAGGGVQLLHARGVVAAPAQPPRPVHLALRAVAADGDHGLTLVWDGYGRSGTYAATSALRMVSAGGATW